MNSELINKAGKKLKILGPLIKEAKLRYICSAKLGSKLRSNGPCAYMITSQCNLH